MSLFHKYRNIHFEISDTVYTPDEWTYNLVEAAENYIQCYGKNLSLLEIGFGSGFIPVYLMRNFENNISKFSGYDVNKDAVSCAIKNLKLNGINMDFVQLCHRSIDELISNEIKTDANLILANLPQIPIFEENSNARSANDYYTAKPRANVDTIERMGLSLLKDLFIYCTSAGKSGSSVLFTISARPSEKKIFDFVRSHFNAFEVLSKKRIKQDPETSLKSIVEIEKMIESQYEFYTHLSDKTPISAARAEQLIASGTTVFHDLYVIRADIA